MASTTLASLPNPMEDPVMNQPVIGYTKPNSGFATVPKRSSMLQWIPTDAQQLAAAEAKMLKPIAGQYHQTTVKTPLCDINTVSLTAPRHSNHIVLLHGFGFGLAQWVPNLLSFSQIGNVHAIDMPGFARSGRATCTGGGQDAVLFFIQTLEEWIKAMWSHEDAPKITLVGHSFGGFVAGKFALNYPQRVEKLMLVDPFGVNEGVPDEVVAARAKDRGYLEKMRNWTAEKLFYKVNPLFPFRGLGPLGPMLIGPKMAKKRDVWEDHTEEGAVVDYLYHANAQSPSGETAFSKCITGLGAGMGDGFVAKFPLLNELPKLDPSIPLFFVYGSHSWIPISAGHKVVRLREELFANDTLPAEVIRRSALPEGHPDLQVPLPKLAKAEVHSVPRSGHHVYVENAQRFNGVVTELLCPGSQRAKFRDPMALGSSQPAAASAGTGGSSSCSSTTNTTTSNTGLQTLVVKGSTDPIVTLVAAHPAASKKKRSSVHLRWSKDPRWAAPVPMQVGSVITTPVTADSNTKPKSLNTAETRKKEVLLSVVDGCTNSV